MLRSCFNHFCLCLQNPRFGTNIVHNTNFDSGLKHWYPQGNCRLSIAHGCPTLLGPAAQKSFMDSPPPGLRGSYLLITNRSYDWEGPAQTITERLQTNMSYQVSAWVATRSPDQPGMKHKVDVCLSVDGKWVQGGEVLAGDVWEEVVGSFRLEKQPENVHVYLQGPGAGVDVMLAGLHIFAVDRSARFPMLRERTDQVPPASHSEPHTLFESPNSVPFQSCLCFHHHHHHHTEIGCFSSFFKLLFRSSETQCTGLPHD